ncbi:MAG: hypothetical protein P8Q91_02915 [Porticoccaceae bacterium]|nr:hypothetical protein [Porticoccaceae bacterium]
MRDLLQRKAVPGPQGSSVWFTDELSEDSNATMLVSLPDPSSETAPEATKLLKQARQRLVLQMNATPLPSGKAVAKLFPLKSPFSRLRYRKYARKEFINYHEAAARKISVPKVYAYLEKRHFGFVAGSGIVIEWLEGQRDLLDIASNSLQGYARAAELGIPALVAMYDAGAMHIDARDENIFLPEQDPTSGYCVIDWQYASFHDPRSEWMLEHLAAYYIRNAPTDQRSALCDAWLLELHRQAHHSIDFESFSARVLALLGARQSVRARLQLRPAR